jgi:uncharacterized protein (TIGR03437 family)
MVLEHDRVARRVLSRFALLVLILGTLLVLPEGRARSAFTVPSGFTDSLVATLSNGTAMDFAPDGRLFVCQQTGSLRVIKNGALLGTLFLNLTVDANGERGLLGVAFDPNFPSDPYVYVYYTTPSPAPHNRISRFTASGDVSVANSELILLELDNLSGATNHNGGAIHFGLDGYLYAAVGDNANANNAETLASLFGKILRIQKDGGIPINPFDAQTTGNRKAIWAMGLRNPFTFSFQRGTGRMFINDVGQNTTEEINDGIGGSNYGWDTCEGPCNPPNASFRDPIYSYAHDGSTCAITGGTFYNPVTTQFPSSFTGTYFFADFCGGWIRNLDPANSNAVTSFATSISSAVDLKVSSSGSLYYLTRDGSGAVRRIDYPANMIGPTVSTHPANQSTGTGQSATFTVAATGPSPFGYQWQKNSVDIPGATSSSYTLPNAFLSDNGATFRAVVTNAFGSAISNNATLTVTIIPIEGDLAPRPGGDGTVVVSDWVQAGRFSVGLDMPAAGTEFQRADCAPRGTLGDGQINVADWVQAGRYSVGLDAPTAPGGPTSSGQGLGPQGGTLTLEMEPDYGLRRVRIVDSRLNRKAVGSVPVEFDAVGDEEAIAFTLAYDPAALTFVEALAGADAKGAAVVVNDRKATTGRIGIALALPPGRTFASGAQRVVALRFLAVGGEGHSSTEIRFDDSLISREIVNQYARSVSHASFHSGNVSIEGSSVAVVSAASFASGPMASEGIAAAFGTRLAASTEAAADTPLPLTLGGTTVTVRDDRGVERRAPLFFVSEKQVNFQIPKGTASGIASVTISTDSGGLAEGQIEITDVAPAFFTNGTIAAGQIYRLGPDGEGVYEPLSQYDLATNAVIPIAIDLGEDPGPIRLVLYGTGFRKLQSLADIRVLIGGLAASVEYAGPHGSLVGLDQLNLRLPKGLAGRGDVLIEVEIEHVLANEVGVRIK